jgi:mRNA interferase MazF
MTAAPMREIALAHLDKPRPVLVLTRETARPGMSRVTVAPITSTIKGLTSEVRVGRANGLDHDGVVSLDNTVTIPTSSLGRTVGFLADAQEHDLARAIVLAFDLDVSIPHNSHRE